jgi:hypothetical protein
MRQGLTAGLFLLCACHGHLTPAADTVTSRAAASPSTAATPDRRYLNANEQRAALARGPVPGYAGDMLDGCNYVVLLTDTLRQAAAARRYFRGRASGCAAGKEPVVRQVRYDFAQLYDWYVGRVTAVWRTMGVTSSSINIQHNRIEIGVESEASPRVRQLLDSLAIPKDAIAIVRGMYMCLGTGGPSVVVRVRDQRSRPAAIGTTIVIQEGQFKDSVDGTHALSELLVGAGERRPGVYEVRLYKPGYAQIVLHDVKAPGNSRCHYAEPSDVRDVTLELLPNAPPVR